MFGLAQKTWTSPKHFGTCIDKALENNFGFQKKDEKNDATDDEALSWKEILDSNIEEATTKKKKSKLKKEKEVSEDAGTSTITISGK